MISEMQKHKENPSSRPYWPKAVSSCSELQACVERSFILLGQSEFSRVFGTRPKTKMPRVPKVTITGLDGKPETCWVFLPEEPGYRKLTLRSIEGERQTAELLAASQHLHSEQAVELSAVKTGQRLEHSALAKLLEPGTMACMSSVAEYKAGLVVCRGI